MKKFLIILILLVAFGGSIYLYNSFFRQAALTVWSFVPSDAVMVFESNNPLFQWEESKEKKIWKNLTSLPIFNKIDHHIEVLDSISGKNGAVQSFFEKNEVLVSFHVISSNSMDMLFTLEVNNLSQHELLSKTIDHYKKTENLTKRTRQYLGYTITELGFEEGSFAYVFYKNYFVGSFTPFLVEDAIRVIEDREILSFQEQHASIFGITKLQQDQGNIFLNTSRLSQITGVFTDPLKGDLSALSSLTDISFLDLSINEDNILMTGFSLNNPLKGNYLDVFNEVVSSEFEMPQVTPDNTAALIHFSFDNTEKWYAGLKNYWRKTNSSILTRMEELEDKYRVETSDLNHFLDKELGLIFLESLNPNSPDMITCLKISDQNAASAFFETFSEATRNENDPYNESWSDIPLHHIEIDELPAQLFGPVFSGFSTTFYCQIGNYLFLGNSEQVLKQLIDQVNSEEMWRKSIKVNSFLEIANKEANVSLLVHSPGAWNMLTNRLNDKWNKFFNEHSLTLKQLEYCAFQFSNIDGKYYTNIALQHPGRIIEKIEASDFELITEQTFTNKLVTKPFVVKNHNNGSLEILVADSLNNVFLVSSDVDTLWRKSLNEKIVSPIYQVDYYKNKKLQYLFATSSLVYIIDRNGETLPGYPFALPNKQEIEFLSLIDYDNSRNYRIMAATNDGNYYLFDKGGVNLEGWKPKSLEGKPVIHPFHMRIRSRDYIVFMHRNGLVYILNRRGEPVSGFPMDLKGNVENQFFIKKGGNISTTTFTTVTNDGEVVEFNLEGKFLKREQMYKTTPSDQFLLVTSSPNNRSFIVLRSDDEKVTVIDSKGKELFNHNFKTPSLSAKYYNFSPDNEVIVITDKNKSYTYLYNKEGRVLHSLPLETGDEIAMLYFETLDIYKLYKTNNNKLSVISLKR